MKIGQQLSLTHIIITNQENAFENVVCKMLVVLFRPQSVNLCGDLIHVWSPTEVVVPAAVVVVMVTMKVMTMTAVSE